MTAAPQPPHVQWRAQAAVLRRRAERADKSEAERAELRARAAWYERRAEIVESGGILPRELRTPLDRLAVVDELRRTAAHLVELLEAIDPEDLHAFVGALTEERETAILLEDLVEDLVELRDMADCYARGLGQQPSANAWAPFAIALMADAEPHV